MSCQCFVSDAPEPFFPVGETLQFISTEVCMESGFKLELLHMSATNLLFKATKTLKQMLKIPF
jgi:hypothetical protein